MVIIHLNEPFNLIYKYLHLPFITNIYLYVYNKIYLLIKIM